MVETSYLLLQALHMVSQNCSSVRKLLKQYIWTINLREKMDNARCPLRADRHQVSFLPRCFPSPFGFFESIFDLSVGRRI